MLKRNFADETEETIPQTREDGVLDVVSGNNNNFILEWYMNKTTRRNERKASQLQHIKEKLYEMKQYGSINNIQSYKKKLNLVKSLKNLKKRIIRKGL